MLLVVVEPEGFWAVLMTSTYRPSALNLKSNFPTGTGSERQMVFCR